MAPVISAKNVWKIFGADPEGYLSKMPKDHSFDEIRAEVLRSPRDRGELCREVCEMRERMRRELGSNRSDAFHLKQGAGGIVDIEFMVQYAVLAEARHHISLVKWSDNIRQLDELEKAGILSPVDASCLRDAYRAQRRASHRLKLQEESSLYPLEQMGEELRESVEGVKRVWKALIGTETWSTT